jgi:multisubunit Na+/H+ antiporter MnhB subunit
MGTEIHWLAILVAAIAGFGVGALWYGPICGKSWMAERGVTQEDAAKANMPLIFGTAFVLNLIAAFVLDHVLGTYGNPDLGLSVMIGGGIALGFIATSFGVNYLFSRLSLRLFLIDAGYWLVVYCLMGVVLQLLR